MSDFSTDLGLTPPGSPEQAGVCRLLAAHVAGGRWDSPPGCAMILVASGVPRLRPVPGRVVASPGAPYGIVLQAQAWGLEEAAARRLFRRPADLYGVVARFEGWGVFAEDVGQAEYDRFIASGERAADHPGRREMRFAHAVGLDGVFYEAFFTRGGAAARSGIAPAGSRGGAIPEALASLLRVADAAGRDTGPEAGI